MVRDRSPEAARSGSDHVGIGLAFFGTIQVLTGLWMAISPGSFFREVAPYGAQNDHFIHDLATFSIALGALMVVAVRRREWRVVALATAVLQYTLHAVSHLIDIGDAGSRGPVNFALIALTAVALAGLLPRAIREHSAGTAR